MVLDTIGQVAVVEQRNNKIQDFIDIIDFKSPRFFFEQKANDLLHNFIQFKLKNYDRRNDPSLSVSSELSAYLHDRLGSIISSVVLVPTDPLKSFGDLYEIKCMPYEIFVSAATANDVLVVAALI